MTLNEWFRTIAVQLNDAEPGREFQRYLLKDMMAAYNAAMCLVVRYRPDLFTEWRVVKLAPGKYQDVRGCCSKVMSVKAQTDEQGNVIHELSGSRATKTTVKSNWKKPSCLPVTAGGGFILDSAVVDNNLDGRFEVTPPVPCGTEAYVMVECVEQACAYTTDQANAEIAGDCAHNVAAWHYVLATMLSGDRFDNAASKDQTYHFRMFFDILGIVQKQDDLADSKEKAS